MSDAATTTRGLEGAAPAWRVVAPALGPDDAETHAMVFDTARGHLFYTHQTEIDLTLANLPQSWELVGATWIAIPVERALPDRPTMAYDTRRGRAVRISSRLLFDHESYTTSYDTPRTFEWDGAAWLDRAPATSFTPRDRAAIAYDEVRGRVVIFGGTMGTGWAGDIVLGDTWEWDGTSWSQRSPATSPPPRVGGAMAFDAARGRAVLFGGWDPMVGIYADTWLWDGSDWTQVFPEVSPEPRYLPSMAYSPIEQRIVLFGGASMIGYYYDTWEWDGATWTDLTAPDAPDGTPDGRRGGAMAYDPARERVVLYGGTCFEPPGSLSSVWEWDGLGWQEHPRPTDGPAAIHSSLVAMTYDRDRDRIVYVAGPGGNGDLVVPLVTFEWDGHVWEPRPADPVPGSRTSASLVYDEVRRRSVYFGGSHSSVPGAVDTWEWDGTSWHPAPTTGQPPNGAVLAFHAGLGRVVAVVNSFNTGPMDTWEWDGAQWTVLAANNRPPARRNAGLTYDRGRDRLVLFGGSVFVPEYGGIWRTRNETWEWDGVTWEERQPAVAPPARNQARLVYDESRARVVMWGGGAATAFSDTWEWDGSSWVETTTGADPVLLGPAAYDHARGQTVLFEAGSGRTWAYAPLDACGAAVAVREFEPGFGSVEPTADALLGGADGQGVTLGTAGAVVVRVSPPIADRPGTDLTIFEVGARAAEVDEPFLVLVSDDGVAFKVGRQCSGGPCLVDLAGTGLASVEFVRLADVGAADPLALPGAGADIDALAVLHCREACNGLDDDRDGVLPADEQDADGDGYVPCEPVPGSGGSVAGGDCDDGEPLVSPGATETYNGRDDNCNGAVDEGVMPPDADADGVADDVDNCPTVANADQHDADGDAAGDACDACPYDSQNDSDRDGVCGDQDACPNSDMSPTVMIDGCDLGVPNSVLGDGCTIMDRLAHCTYELSIPWPKVQRCMGRILDELSKEGVITSEQRQAFELCLN